MQRRFINELACITSVESHHSSRRIHGNAGLVKWAQRTRGVGDAGHEASLLALANEVLRAAACIQVPPKGRPRLHSA